MTDVWVTCPRCGARRMAVPGAATFRCYFCNHSFPVAGNEEKPGPIKVKDLTTAATGEAGHGFVRASQLPREVRR